MSIDYARMQREFPKQKAELSRAVKLGYEAVVESTRRTIATWNEIGAWPDDWAHWQRTLDDAYSEACQDWIAHRRDTKPMPTYMDYL